MSRLTKFAAAAHREACGLVDSAHELSAWEKQFVLDHYHGPACLDQRARRVSFTPSALARAMTIHVVGTRIVDLCAGIGHLAFACANTHGHAGEPAPQLLCIEQNPKLVRVGMKIVPEARWLCADILDLGPQVRRFDVAIANPPHGRVVRTANAPGYHGHRFEYHAIAIAASMARQGVFLIPQSSAPLRLHGRPSPVVRASNPEYRRFVNATGIVLTPSYWIDTSRFDSGWHQRPRRTEVGLSYFADPTVQR